MSNRRLPLCVRFAAVFAFWAVATCAFSADESSSSSSTNANSKTATAPKSNAPAVAHADVAKPMAPAISLAGVQWAGQGLTETVKGKTTVVVSFVTWCPICNGWAPDMVSQLKAASADKPVVILAIATDVGPAAAKEFIQKKGLIGPNVMYGSSANMDQTMGLDKKNLWNFVMVGPTGAAAAKGAAGAAYIEGAKKVYAPGRSIANSRDLGKLEFLTPDMSDNVKNVVWQLELGNMALLPQISQPKNLHGLSKDEQASLTELSTKFLDGQLATIKELVAGEMPQRLEGFDKATTLSTYFRATPQGKEAFKTTTELSADPEFRREVSAKKLYFLNQSKAGGNEVQLTKLMHVVALRYPDTYYGGLAKQEIDAAPKTGKPDVSAKVNDDTKKS